MPTKGCQEGGHCHALHIRELSGAVLAHESHLVLPGCNLRALKLVPPPGYCQIRGIAASILAQAPA